MCLIGLHITNLLLDGVKLFLDFDIIDGWYVELERMNEGKRGATYGYPNSFVQLLGYVKAYFTSFNRLKRIAYLR